jgi:hypothetical protein
MRTQLGNILFLALVCVVGGQQAYAATGVWDNLMRASAHGDDVFKSVRRVDEIAADLARSGTASRTLSRELGAADNNAIRTRRVRELLNASLHQPDAGLLRQIEALAPQEMESALVLARGSQRLVNTVPDVANRARLLRDGGADLVAATGLHGEALAREAAHLDTLVSIGQVPGRLANEATLARFAQLMRRDDGGAWSFWQQWVTPHWKKWATGGALAAYLAEPELFHDAAGQISNEGARRLNELLGSIVAGGIEGAAEGGEKAAQAIWQKFSERYLHGPKAWIAWLGLAAALWFLGVLLPRTRRLCLAPLAWFFHKPRN